MLLFHATGLCPALRRFSKQLLNFEVQRGANSGTVCGSVMERMKNMLEPA